MTFSNFPAMRELRETGWLPPAEVSPQIDCGDDLQKSQGFSKFRLLYPHWVTFSLRDEHHLWSRAQGAWNARFDFQPWTTFQIEKMHFPDGFDHVDAVVIVAAFSQLSDAIAFELFG